MEIPFIDIDRVDMLTEERAEARLENLLKKEAGNKAYAEENGSAYVSNVHKMGRQGSVVFVMRFSRIDSGEIGYLHAVEARDRDAMALLQGRKILPSHNGAEHGSGLTDGMELERY